MKTIALLALLALCACSDHHHRHNNHDGYDGRRRQVDTSHHDQQSQEDAGDWWNWKKRHND
jgi:hypothetical protein